MVLHPLLFSTAMGNYTNKDYKDDDIDIYDNGNDSYIPDQDYCVNYGSLVGTVADTGKLPARYERLNVQILEGRKCGTDADGDDDDDIDKNTDHFQAITTAPQWDQSPVGLQ